jgi:hypothetical protein
VVLLRLLPLLFSAKQPTSGSVWKYTSASLDVSHTEAASSSQYR